jgi:hypothetical protein
MSAIPRALLLGDSIRLSYQPHVASLLHGRAEVVGRADNGQYSEYTLFALERWIADLGQRLSPTSFHRCWQKRARGQKDLGSPSPVFSIRRFLRGVVKERRAEDD